MKGKNREKGGKGEREREKGNLNQQLNFTT
jgi:hypothetical protein